MRTPRGRTRLDALTIAIVSLFTVLAPAALPSPLSAQVSPADSAAVLLAAASDFEREGRSEIADAIYRHITARFGGTPAGAEALARLSGPGSRVARISGAEVPVFAGLYGLWLGVAVPSAFGAESEKAYGAGLLIGGPLGLLTARAALRARAVTEGQARAISWGGIWGTWLGYAVADVLDLGQKEICDPFGCYEIGDESEEKFASMIVGGLTGIAAGALIARGPVASGVSSAAQGGSIWGSVYGAMVAELFDPADHDVTLAVSTVTGNVGLLAGIALARRFEVDRPRARMLNIGALLGGLGGIGIDLLISVESDRTAIAIPLVTSVVGLGIAAYGTRGGDPEFGAPADRGGALLDLRDGRWSMDVPIPRPAVLSMQLPNGGTALWPGLTFQLLEAAFH